MSHDSAVPAGSGPRSGNPARAGHAVYAGIDGGGTRTRLALVADDGTLLGQAEGGSCCFTDVGVDGARAELRGLWRTAWLSAGIEPRPADGLYLGLGSVLSGADVRTNLDIALGLELGRAGAVGCENDAWIALAGGLCGRPGILLIAGTGSACLGRDAAGRTWRAGGWGYLLDDAGSAHAFGMAAMIAATRDVDGRGEPTALTGVVKQALGLEDFRAIFRKLHHEGVARSDVATLAPRVVSLAEEGDTVAGRILARGVEGLVEMVVTVARRLGLERAELALTGGLIDGSAGYRRRFLDRLAVTLPDLRIAGDGLAPVLGAVVLAAELGTGSRPPADFLGRLRASTATFAGSR